MDSEARRRKPNEHLEKSQTSFVDFYKMFIVLSEVLKKIGGNAQKR